MPFLKFHDVALRVGHIDQGETACALDVNGHQFAHIAAAPAEDFRALGIHIRHFKGEVSEAGTVERCGGRGLVPGVGEDFNRRPMVPVPRQAQVPPANPFAGHSRERVNVRPVVIALGADGFAVEDLRVKIRHALPVVGDQVRMRVTDAGGMRCVRVQSEWTLPRQAQARQCSRPFSGVSVGDTLPLAH